MEPIEVVFDDPRSGLQRFTAWIQPPQRHHGEMRDVRFGLRKSSAR
jgi:hypothetical protein